MITLLRGVCFVVASLLLAMTCFDVYAAPCYGTHFPNKDKWSVGAQVHAIENRSLKKDFGKAASTQYFYQMSFGVFDWFSLDGKIGVGDVKYKASSGEKTSYPVNFAGGYGFRIKPYKNEAQKIETVFGFQHISVHPGSKKVSGVKNTVILDDWQISGLLSKGIGNFTPYAGARLTRLDLIHRIEGSGRERKESDVDVCPVVGADFNFTPSDFLNAEIRFVEETSFSLALTHNF